MEKGSLAPCILALLLAGCASKNASNMKELLPTGPVSTAEKHVGDDTYRVILRASPGTSERNLDALVLRRSAELTLEKGYSGFILLDRHVHLGIPQTKVDAPAPAKIVYIIALTNRRGFEVLDAASWSRLRTAPSALPPG